MDSEADHAAEVRELRLALMAMVSAEAARGGSRCASALDEAARLANHAPRNILSRLGIPAATGVQARFGATRAINSLCAACGECPRGAQAAPERLMEALPPEPPER